MNINDLLIMAVEQGASDLHVSAGRPPTIRVDGDIRITDEGNLEDKIVRVLLNEIMDEDQKQLYEKEFEVDFSYEIPNFARFRVNVFNQNRGAAAVFRTIPSTVLSMESLEKIWMTGMTPCMASVHLLPGVTN